MNKLLGVATITAVLSSFMLSQQHNGSYRLKIEQVQTIGDGDSDLFLGIYGLAPLQKGAIIVSDKLDYKLKEIDGKGKIKHFIGKRGKGTSEFMGPGPVAAWNNIVAVADFASPRIQLFTLGFNYKSTIFAPAAIIDLQFDGDGNLWVGMESDGHNDALIKMDLTGHILETVHLKNLTSLIWQNLFEFTIRPEGELVIAYLEQNKIELWETSGKFKQEFSVPTLPDKPPMVTTSSGLQIPDAIMFFYVAVNRKGYIFLLLGEISNPAYRNVIVMSPNGQFISQFSLAERTEIIKFDAEDSFYTVEQRSQVKKYRVHYHGF